MQKNYAAIKNCNFVLLITRPGILKQLFEILIGRLGYDYLEKALELVEEKLSSVDSKTEPESGFFSIVKVSNHIVQMIQLHFQSYEVDKIWD